MGVFKFFSYDSRDTSQLQATERVIEKLVRVNSTPDPTKFKILKKEVINGFPIFLVEYPGVTNFEGRKILMYPQYFNTDVIVKRMDPHFFDKGDSPIARFEPTKYGWKLATTLALQILTLH